MVKVLGLFTGAAKKMAANKGFYIRRIRDNAAAPALGFLVRAAIALFVSYCVSLSLLDIFNIGFDKELLFRVSAAASFISSAFCINWVLTAAGYGVAAYAAYSLVLQNLPSFRVGIKYVLNISYAVIVNSLDMPAANGFDNVEAGEPMLLPIVVLMAAGIAFISGFIIVRLRCVLLYSLCAAAVLGASVFFKSSMPNWAAAVIICGGGALFGINLAGGGLSLFSLIRYRLGKMKQKSDGVFAAQLAVLTAAFMLCGSFCAGKAIKNRYDDTQVPQLNTQLKYALRDLGTMLYAQHLDGVIMDNIGYGQLGFFSNVNVKFSKAMTVECEPIEEGTKLYLRGYIASDYDYRGNAWRQGAELADEAAFNSIVTQLKERGVEPKEIKLSIKIKNSLEYAYMPYYSDTADSAALKYVNDNSVITDEKDYTLEQYPISGTAVNIDDSAYREYAYKTYLGLDEGNRTVLNKIMAENNINKDNIADALEKYYRDNFTYDMSSEIVPYGEDFVNYFLLHSKKGNFAQFATATTLFYRALGIPARYVGGYAADAEQLLAGKWNDDYTRVTADIQNANMYAWTEIYRDGIGWLVVDLSPALGFEEMAERYSNTESTTEATTINIAKAYFGEDRELAQVVRDKGIEASAGAAVKILAVAASLLIALGILIAIVFIARFAFMKGEEKLLFAIAALRLCLQADRGDTPLMLFEKIQRILPNNGNIQSIAGSVQRALYAQHGLASSEAFALRLKIYALCLPIIAVRLFGKNKKEPV